MIEFGTAEEARVIAGDITSYLSYRHPSEHPMLMTAAVAMTLGAMVAAMHAHGISDPDRRDDLVAHLLTLALAVADAPEVES